MYEFTKIERITPTLRPADERVGNFDEINEVYTTSETASQASRCVQCGNPYCSSVGCPLSNYIPQWLRFIAEKDLEQAFKISNESSPFPEILGRICPQDRLCEGACTLNDGNDEETIGAITIGSIEVAISEKGFKKGFKPEFADKMTGKTVAIVGSGPAGLSCATFLLRAGVKPVVFDKADKAGGLLTYGIPGFKLEKEAVERRVELLKEAGMELNLGVDIGNDITLDELRKNYDAVFLGIGAMAGRTLDDEVYNTDNIYMAVPFLTNIQKKIEDKQFDKKYDVEGKRVVVIGGGDTAMDCVRTSIREKAAKVTCFYRRDEENMPGSRKEVRAAKDEGVEFNFLKSPKSFVADDKGNVYGSKFVDMKLSEPDASGRQAVSEIAGSESIVEADVFILALGFNNEKLKWITDAGVETDKWGALKTDEKGQTSLENVFAGGDSVRGADLVVTAALDGREAAMSILESIFDEEPASV
ncbi:glutamate synthase subunit beta [Flammeovirga yaeyamensis]|uniref:Glutamate synthase subunit beta n=1 Tax=Flammeovirga yaeyamensis TaxID=367791 RepID=A0AAX1NBU2_9BACT|nr:MULTISPECIES: glutamate synthase subunit beta [Flammeovirga]ANQ48977.1 glutamate synthase subunit beta [Flammeovirga sp. MY04]MBB3699061.1 glutamate synthase (NADPH/NADH) small chain [Flammeovirga yaeyamensis]NMF36495.1 glutamate synthase subunit beta [Flammeovirga yaeyamensis]QWG03547.1 glutamate synthase subunit beta [Flammeovirga yaeyamensis]